MKTDRLVQTILGAALVTLWLFAEQLGITEHAEAILGLGALFLPSGVTIGRGVSQFLDSRRGVLS